MSADRLINPALYWCLQQHFGDVTIRDAGTPLRYDYVYDQLIRRQRLTVIDCGERTGSAVTAAETSESSCASLHNGTVATPLVVGLGNT